MTAAAAPARGDAGRLRPLPPVAAHVDDALARMDAEVDWLLALSPVQNDLMWAQFEASGRREIPPLRYMEPKGDLAAVREALRALPVEDVESPLLSGLLGEKQRELERQVELVRLRATDGFLNASLDLFGDVPAPLLALAQEILAQAPPESAPEADAGIDVFMSAVEQEVAWYRERSPGFDLEVVVDTDLASLMMVSHGTLYVDGDLRVPHERVQPLIQHEIGTHVVTRHNGARQSLRQLEVGLAHYDPLQEGLGVLAEFIAGYLPLGRLRVLAARVVAVDMAIRGESVPAIFDLLHATHAIPTDEAFDIAVRALRGGGLTKDAVYLKGLRDLVDYLHDDGPFAPLFVGKFALSHRAVLDQLVDEGWVAAPDLLPRYCALPDFNARLARCRTTPIADFFHKEPLQ